MGASKGSGDPRGAQAPGLSGAFVVLGVSGGIAAYKAVEVCRLLVEAGAHVVPVLTEAATRFVGATTFSALASEPAEWELFGGAHPIPHTRLGQRADLVVVAPATARLIGEYAHGIAADLLGATLLATRAPVVVCPAMHTEMWDHPAVVENVAILRRRGVHIVGPTSGRLAGGDLGEGRLAEPAAILAAIEGVLAPQALSQGARRASSSGQGDLAGLAVLVSAGGTKEPIDAVRVIANRSSGRQGHALAEIAASRGATVCLVTASELEPPSGVEVVRVETAAQLAAAVLERAEHADVVVMAAAVADFRPVHPFPGKLSKRDGTPEIVLEPTEDVLALLGRRRRPGQVLVGFAAESGPSAIERAQAKLEEKGADLFVVNDVSSPGVGFGHETNAVTILDRDGGRTDVALAPKPTIAAAVLDAVVAWRLRRGMAHSAEPSGAFGRGAVR
jgi:phosphopantothenoylcysteine decarboxylase/phosphopantothenate--cysteine ligase